MKLSKLDSIKDVSLDELIVMGGEIREEMKNFDSAKNVINAEILDRLAVLKRDGKESGGWMCTVRSLVSFRGVDLSVARDLGAVMETVDTKKLAALDKNGVKIQGKKTTEFVDIRRKEDA